MIMRKTVVSGVIGLVSLLTANLASAISVSTNPSNVVVNVGDTFQVSIDAADFPTTAGGGFFVNWDSGLSLLTTDAEIETNMIFDTPSSQTTGNQTRIVGGNFGAPVSSTNFTIVTLEFQALAAGSSNITLSAEPTELWVDETFATLDPQPDYFGTSVTVNDLTAVPLPGAVWLFGTGLLGMVGVARRRSPRTA
jgi:hypothetical protein